MNNALKRTFEIFNCFIFAQFIQSHDIFLSNLFDEELNQFDFINIDLFKKTLNET